MKLINKQKSKGACAVVAYANLHKLMGKKMSYKKALKRMGGTPPKTGVPIKLLAQKLQQNFDVFVLKLTYKEVKVLAKDKKVAVAVCYAWKGKNKNNAHVAVMDRKCNSINAVTKPINSKRWKETKKVWRTGPLTIVIMEKQ